jgi:hypothetical protein
VAHGAAGEAGKPWGGDPRILWSPGSGRQKRRTVNGITVTAEELKGRKNGTHVRQYLKKNNVDYDERFVVG